MSHQNGHRKNLGSVLLLVLLLVGYPAIAPLSVLLDVPNRLISIPFRAIILFLALSIIFKHLLSRRSIPGDLFWLAWWGFWGLYVGRMFVDGMFNPEALRLPLYEYILWGIGLCFLPALALAMRPPADFRLVVKFILILGTFAIVVNLWLIYRQPDIKGLTALLEVRRGADTLNPISLSHLGVSLILLATWTLFRQSDLRFVENIYLFIAVATGLLALFAGASRGPMLTLIVLLPLVAYELLRDQKVNLRYWLKVMVTIVLALAAVIWLVTSFDQIAILSRMESGMFKDHERERLYKTGFDTFISNPLLGAGVEPIGFYPHNVILESFMLNGVFSGLLFVGLLAYSTFCAFRRYINSPEVSWLSILFSQYLMAAMFSGALYDSTQMWSMMALAVVAIQADANKYHPQLLR
jgi:hypothetical protein